MKEPSSSIGCGLAHRDKINEIAFLRKRKVKPMLHEWIDAGCPIPDKKEEVISSE